MHNLKLTLSRKEFWEENFVMTVFEIIILTFDLKLFRDVMSSFLFVIKHVFFFLILYYWKKRSSSNLMIIYEITELSPFAQKFLLFFIMKVLKIMAIY